MSFKLNSTRLSKISFIAALVMVTQAATTTIFACVHNDNWQVRIAER